MKVVEWTEAGGTVGAVAGGERTVYLKLVNRFDGATLVTCDRTGKEIGSTNILTIGKDGKVKLHPSVARDCGLSLVEPRRYIEVCTG